MELAEIWEPKRGHIWMKQWLETHHLLKAARDTLKNASQTGTLPDTFCFPILSHSDALAR